MNARRIAMWSATGFAGFYLVTSPESAAGVVTGVWQFLAGAAQSLSTFVNALS